MDLQLKNKTVLITGSSKGIGFALAKVLAAEGCNIGICARNKDEVNADCVTSKNQYSHRMYEY